MHEHTKIERDGKYYEVRTDQLDPMISHGIDLNLFGEPSKPYETMVFEVDEYGDILESDLDKKQYGTASEARAGHDRMVKKWRNK